MKLHRFFVTQDLSTKKEVVIRDSELHNQLKNVFRFTAGGQVILLDGTGYEYLALVHSFGYGEVTFSIASKRFSKNIPDREIYLFCSIVKKDKFEWILEKGTELGVSRFIPILSDRSEKKDLNFERAQRILKEATEQSERAIIPTIEPIIKFDDLFEKEIPLFVFDPKGDTFVVEHAQKYSPLGICIGPEGGWTERELSLFKRNKMPVYSLGRGVLKTETAALAVSALLLL
jgi:16S rRNA (uracil1498-N3)-methyltransferase